MLLEQYKEDWGRRSVSGLIGLIAEINSNIQNIEIKTIPLSRGFLMRNFWDIFVSYGKFQQLKWRN